MCKFSVISGVWKSGFIVSDCTAISIDKRLCPCSVCHTFSIILIFSNIFFESAVSLFLEGDIYYFRLS